MKKYYFLTLFFLLKSFSVYSQNVYTLNDKPYQYVTDFEILPNKNYPFQQVLTDSTLVFVKYNRSLGNEYLKGNKTYWLKLVIENPSDYDKNLYILIHPQLDNTIYDYDTKEKEWKTTTTGLEIDDNQRKIGMKKIVIKSNSTDTIFAKVDIKFLSQQENFPHFYINLVQEEYHNKSDQYAYMVWGITIAILILFFLYNLYVYFAFLDKTYIYYLTIILGGMLYITSFFDMFNILIPFRFYNAYVGANGRVYLFNIGNTTAAIGICTVLIGFVKFTSTYLKLNKHLPSWNRALHYLLYFSVLFIFGTAILTVTRVGYFANALYTMIDNVLAAVIILLLFVVGILSLKKGYKPARYFLLANAVPLLIMLVLSIYFSKYGSSLQKVSLLPSFAIILQALTFAVALVARINLIKDELKEKQLEAKDLQQENDKMLARNRYIELENEQIISEMVSAVNKTMDLEKKMEVEENQKTELQEKVAAEIKQKADLQAKLEANQRELTANTLYLYQKNEMLSSLQKQIQSLSYKDTTDQNREGIREIKSTIKNDVQLEGNWDNFKLHFEKVHPNFFEELKEKYPTLTKNEIRLSAYDHLNISVKEIAALSNINPESVHKARTRLNKKKRKFEEKN